MKRFFGILTLAAMVLLVAGYTFLATYDYNQLKPRIVGIVKAHTGRDIHLDGDIKVGIGLSPRLSVESATFQNASWGSRPDALRVKKLEVQFDLFPLLKGALRLKRLLLVEPDILIELNEAGRSNLAFDLPATAGKENRQPAPQSEAARTEDVFALKQVDIKSAKITINDQRSQETALLDIEQLSLQAPHYADPASLKMEVAYNGEPIRISGRLGALSSLFRPDQTWPVKLSIDSPGVAVTIDGTIQDPLRPKRMDLEWSTAGDDLSALQKIVGLPLFKVPFSMSGHLKYLVAESIELSDLQVKLADSDVKGALSLAFASDEPAIALWLRSNSVDLRPLFEPGSQKNPDKKPPHRPADKTTVFPERPLSIGCLAGFEASLDAEIARLILPGIAIDTLNAKAAVRNGTLELTRMTSKIGGGDVAAELSLAPRGNQIDVVTTISATQVDLGQMLKILKITNDLEGILDLTVKLKGQGHSVAGILAGLDGDLIATLGNGQMPTGYLDLFGTDIATSLIQLLDPFGKEIDRAAFNCMVADFNISNGLAKSDIIILDDPRKTLIGTVDIDFKTEALAVWIETKPKEGIGTKQTGKVSISLEGLTKPFKLGGTLSHPKLELDTLQTAKVAGTALLGPAGIAWLMLSRSSGKEDPCVTAKQFIGEGPYQNTSKSKGVKGFFNR